MNRLVPLAVLMLFLMIWLSSVRAVDPDLVVQGFLHKADGAAGIITLLDERQTSFDALVALDGMAVGAMDVMRARGIHTPRDVAVIGLNGVEETRYVTPPLTTMPFQAYKQAYRATQLVFDMIAGLDVPQQILLPSKLWIRQSCGCA